MAWTLAAAGVEVGIGRNVDTDEMSQDFVLG